MKTIAGILRGHRTVELSEYLDLPDDTAVLVVIPEGDDEAEMRKQLLSAAEIAFGKMWDNEGDDVWNEYL